MPEEPELRPRSIDLAGFTITRRPRRGRSDYFHVKAAALTGLAVAALHDGVYRQTQPQGEGDFELWGTISHAGLDMLILLAFVTVVLVLVEWGRIR